MQMAINQDGLYELIIQNDQSHRDSHQRLRGDVSRIDEALEVLGESHQTNKARLAKLEAALELSAQSPIDVNKLVATPKIVASIVFVIVGMVGSMWAITADLRSDVRNVLTLMASEQRVSDANAKLIDANNRELKDALDQIRRRQDLLTLQYQELKDKLTAQAPRAPR